MNVCFAVLRKERGENAFIYVHDLKLIVQIKSNKTINYSQFLFI